MRFYDTTEKELRLDGTDKAFDEMFLRRIILIGELHRVGQGAVGLQYLEEFLQFDHQLPVGLDEVVAEVILARVNTGA